MSEDEQIAICKAIAVSCMWGQGGIASVILERLEKAVPLTRPWQEVHREVEPKATRAHIGEVSSAEELAAYLRRGYWLTNFDDDGCSLFYPPPMGGLAMYVPRALAEMHREWWLPAHA